MILFHNTDISNLNSILERGLLPANKCWVNNWDKKRCAQNSRDVVYLSEPIGKQNSFTNYGIALLVVRVMPNEISPSQLAENDFGRGRYYEYTVASISPDKILHIYIPKLFCNRIAGLSGKVLEKVIWCNMTAQVFDYCEETGEIGAFGIPKTRSIYRNATEAELKRFGETAELSVYGFNYFRGIAAENTMIDLYNIVYDLNTT